MHDSAQPHPTTPIPCEDPRVLPARPARFFPEGNRPKLLPHLQHCRRTTRRLYRPGTSARVGDTRDSDHAAIKSRSRESPLRAQSAPSNSATVPTSCGQSAHAPPLTEFRALLAARLASRPALTMPRLNSPPVRAVITIVMHVPMLRRVLRRVRVKGVYFCHGRLLSPQPSIIGRGARRKQGHRLPAVCRRL